MRMVRSAVIATVVMAGVAATQIAGPQIAAAQSAEAPRAALVRAAFATSSKAQATSLVNGALKSLDTTLARSPNDRDARLQRGIGMGYRGQLTNSMGDAKAARTILADLAQGNPTNPEAQLALGGWHLSVIGHLGGFVGSTVLGADRNAGLGALDRAVRLGGDRAFFPAYAGLMRIRLDAGDKQALALLERAGRGATPAEVDRITKAAAVRVAALLRAGDAKGASALARQSLPFGRVG